jgi:ankyrin repeat protein
VYYKQRFNSLSAVTNLEPRFLLAKLYLDIVAAKHNVNGIRTALHSLTHATGSCDSSCEDAYGRAYADIMARIDGSDPDRGAFARDILSWIVCARRPLTELELRHALAVDPGNRGDLDFGNLSSMESILSACAGLVAVDSESGIVRLVHPTAYDYLRKKGTASSPEAHARIAGVCAIYLSFDAFATGACHTDADFERRLRMHPLYQYAARNWGHHASRAGPAVPTEVVAFLRAGGRKLDAATQALFAYTPTANNNTTHAHRQPGYSQDVPRLRTGLQLAACVGTSDVIAELLRTLPPDSIGSVVNETDDAGRSPLAWAAEYGHEGVVARLLDSGEVHVKRTGHNGRTPLSIAAGRGAEGVVRLLLSREEDVGVRDVDDAGMTALAWAAEGGHEGVVQLLLEAMVEKIPQNTSRCMPSDTLKDNTAPDTSQHDAQHTPRYNTRYRARHSAQHTHSDDTPEDTPKDTPKPTPKAKDLLIPLQSAIDNGHETIVQQLVNAARSDPNWEDHYGPKALHQAAASGSVASVQCILASSAAIDVDSAAEDDDDRNNSGRTPLMTAAQHGHAELVMTLLSTTRALPQWKDRSLRTALSLAAAEGQDAVVELLLADGRVELDAKDHEGKTALFWAVTNGYDDTARLLLERGKAAVDTENRYGQTPLAVALDNGDGAMVELLREFGAADVKPGASMDDMFSRIQLAFHAVQLVP